MTHNTDIWPSVDNKVSFPITDEHHLLYPYSFACDQFNDQQVKKPVAIPPPQGNTTSSRLLNLIPGRLIKTSQVYTDLDLIKKEPTVGGRFRNWLPAQLPPVKIMRPDSARGSLPPHIFNIAYLNVIVNRT
jgi:hypothetical protein